MSDRVQIKDGVDLSGLHISMIRALPFVMETFDRAGFETIITSGLDGQHSVGSLHYKGRALDFRTRHLPGGSTGQAAKDMAHEIRSCLIDDYDVVHESTHIHVEYDPK
ncbi:MAG: hypothetical protein HRU11_12165 [Parvularculaceae bacterium]|nr:hypothetical protein [Parvularculaceae bacterium]